MPSHFAAPMKQSARALLAPCQHGSASTSGRSSGCRPHVADSRPCRCAASRREVSVGTLALLLSAGSSRRAGAVQGLTAGRIKGTQPDPELGDQGIDLYTRPLGKSGGHGIGWSEIPQALFAPCRSCTSESALTPAMLAPASSSAAAWMQYRFRIPHTWEETPVSIADSGGTEIDIRFSNRDEGELQVVVAPVLRFKDVGNNANVGLEDLGEPDRIIAGFTPELFGKPLDDGDVQDTQVYQKDGNTYYQFQLKPHRYVTATATGNRLFLLAANANSRQYRRGAEHLRMIADSFYVPPEKSYNTGF